MTDYSKLTDAEINELIFKQINPAAYDIIQLNPNNNTPFYDYVNDKSFCFDAIVANGIVLRPVDNPPSPKMEYLAHLLPYNTQAWCPTPQRAVLECCLQIAKAEQTVAV